MFPGQSAYRGIWQEERERKRTGKEMASISTALAVDMSGKDSNSGRKFDNSTLSKYEVYELSSQEGTPLAATPTLAISSMCTFMGTTWTYASLSPSMA